MGIVKRAMEDFEDRGWEASDSFVCEECVDDHHLKHLIAENVSGKICNFCKRRSHEFIAAPVEVILEPIALALFYHYCDPTQGGVPYEGGFIIEPIDTDNALFSLPLNCNSELFEEIVRSFSNDAWVSAANGDWTSSHASEVLGWSWGNFVEVVKHEKRYFFGLETEDGHREEISPPHLLTQIARIAGEFSLIRPIEINENLYRVREILPGQDWTPNEKTMGAPPRSIVQAGRMNPAGISYLYLAFEPETALAEIVKNPPASFIIAKFRNTSRFTILDLVNLPKIPSIFDDEHRQEREGLLFLKAFVKEISKPVGKDGREHIDYVPSQVVCEYFARVFALQQEGGLDGILYPSAVRPGGKNLVLFPAHSRFEQSFPHMSFISSEVVHLGNWEDVANQIKV